MANSQIIAQVIICNCDMCYRRWVNCCVRVCKQASDFLQAIRKDFHAGVIFKGLRSTYEDFRLGGWAVFQAEEMACLKLESWKKLCFRRKLGGPLMWMAFRKARCDHSWKLLWVKGKAKRAGGDRLRLGFKAGMRAWKWDTRAQYRSETLGHNIEGSVHSQGHAGGGEALTVMSP